MKRLPDDQEFEIEDYVKIGVAVWDLWQKRGDSYAVHVVMSVLMILAEKDKPR